MRTSGYLLYAAGQVGVMMLTRYFFQWVIRFSDGTAPGAQAALFSASLVGAVFFVFRIFDAAIDPITGALGDLWVRRGKERRSLLWFALPWAPLGLGLVFLPHADMGEGLRWALLLAGMFFFFTGYSIYSIPLWSLIEDYSMGDGRARTRLSNVQGIGILLATGVGFVLSPIAVSKLGFSGGAWAFGLVGLLLMILPYFAAPPGYLDDLAARRGAAEEAPRSTGSFLGVLADRDFRRVIVLFVGAQMSFTVMTAAAPYIAERLLGGTIGDVALLLGPFLLSALVCFVFVPRWARARGWRRMTLLGAICLGVAYFGAGLLGRAIVGTPLTTAMIVFALAGPGAAIILGLEGEAIARSAADTGREVTGTYFGFFNLVVQCLNGLALALTGWLAESARTSAWAVRAMPMMAGALCLLGVLGYLALGRGAARSAELAGPPQA